VTGCEAVAELDADEEDAVAEPDAVEVPVTVDVVEVVVEAEVEAADDDPDVTSFAPQTPDEPTAAPRFDFR